MTENKHGLSRSIPDAVKREVRQRCGFGCIVCGCAVIQYHHFNPEYADAVFHDPDGITLLCGRCHDKSRQHFSTKRIEQLNQSPWCKKAGYVRDEFLFLAGDRIHFQMGSATFKEACVIAYEETPLIAFAPPQNTDEPLRLFANLQDQDGSQLMDVFDNEWRVGANFFDVETVSNTLTVRSKPGKLLLRMTLRDGDIVFDRLQIGFNGFKIGLTDGRFDVTSPNGGRMVLSCPNIHATLQLKANGTFCL